MFASLNWLTGWPGCLCCCFSLSGHCWQPFAVDEMLLFCTKPALSEVSAWLSLMPLSLCIRLFLLLAAFLLQFLWQFSFFDMAFKKRNYLPFSNAQFLIFLEYLKKNKKNFLPTSKSLFGAMCFIFKKLLIYASIALAIVRLSMPF